MLLPVMVYARTRLSHDDGTITSHRRGVRTRASPLLWTRGAEEAWVSQPDSRTLRLFAKEGGVAHAMRNETGAAYDPLIIS